jgi:myo-inositol-1(or 4)-monophosphatase
VLVREAGGLVSEIDGGNVMSTGSILAGNEDIVPLVREQLRLAGAFGRQANIT